MNDVVDAPSCAIVIGGRGLVGSALVSKLNSSSNWELHYSQRGVAVDERSFKLDLATLHDRAIESVTARIVRGRTTVFLVAACTGVVRCEAEPETWAVNFDAPVQLALAAAAAGGRPIFISSDAVSRAPHTAYARQKAMTELGVLGCGGIVVRPSRITQDGAPAFASYLRRVAEVAEQTGVRSRIFKYET